MKNQRQKNQSNPLLLINQLSKDFYVAGGAVRVLNDINLTIDVGQFVVIVGPSGCGKSTLLHLVLGLERASNGKVILFNQELSELSEDQIASIRKLKIGIVYQQPYWMQTKKVIDNVAFVGELLGEHSAQARVRAEKLLAQLGMLTWQNYFPSELSSGQQQKVAMARALMNDPELLIADEPTGNLDTQASVELMGILQKSNQVGKTVIMVTHDLEFVRFATHVVQMSDGRIIKVAQASEVLADLGKMGKRLL